MTTPSAVYGQFGQALAFAERTMTGILHEHLAQRGTKPETWYALQLVATRGPGLSRQALSRDLDGSRNVEPSAAELLARLEAEGLISGDAHVDLTAGARPCIAACASTSAARPPGCSASSTSTTSRRLSAQCRPSPGGPPKRPPPPGPNSARAHTPGRA